MKQSSLARAALYLFLAASLAAPLAGCGKTVLPSANGQGANGQIANGQGAARGPVAAMPSLFTPLETHAAVTLADAEALRLVRQLSPRQQGLSSWRDMDAAVARSLSFARNKPANGAALSFPGLTATWGDIARSAELLQRLLPSLDAKPELLASSFRWVRLGPDFSFTGYYEPTLAASRKPTGKLSHPLYKRPPDLRNGVPYFTRNQIDRGGALRGKGLEIAYVDETDAFFLHVQGSGRLRFQDGSVIHVLYAAKNNRSYVSLGRVMKERGLLPEDGVNMKAIREYLAKNPGQRAELFDENPSYVFFRAETYGPIGSMGAVITPWVSLAVDRRSVPQGSVAMILTPLPGPDGRHTRPFPALTLPQDSGGAIKGHRMDLFCGAGDEAEHVAGHLDVKGAVYILLPK
ncbi:MltA specific insert domain-containing protein [uncultured delta proteobacterium]|uniref:peptidoglycan lytic exotransglycosylase n=1 Tax=uncultured delta proteobacterium TaxID=34034 RepID=A0A212JJ92_9DELT|nr:MltA specific insert domain-containing protein [uncultured delta proteobacterium]